MIPPTCPDCRIELDTCHGRHSGQWFCHHTIHVACPSAAWGGKTWTFAPDRAGAITNALENRSSWTTPPTDFLQWFDRVVDHELAAIQWKKLNGDPERKKTPRVHSVFTSQNPLLT